MGLIGFVLFLTMSQNRKKLAQPLDMVIVKPEHCLLVIYVELEYQLHYCSVHEFPTGSPPKHLCFAANHRQLSISRTCPADP